METNKEQTPDLETRNAQVPEPEEVPVEATAPEQEQPAEQNAAAGEPEQPKEPEQEAEAPEAPEAPKEQEPAPEPEQPKEPKQPEAGKAESDKLLRLMAEFDNYKKRSIREREAIYSDVRVDTVSRFLPVYDNLCRALSAETADEAYKRGVELIYNQLMSVFKGLGVTAIEAEGQPFDPQLHNAVMHVEDETVGDSTVVQELQKGFRLGDRVIRFSMVKVAN
ncbi:MAG: nucleotide exchange factor GrpE [Oscillospiraceae bacterium]|nr:nucleotide exchange factor GrpE [Oscillospiraceae bacterium]